MNKFYTYIKKNGRNQKIKIESVLNSGLPKVSFSGFHESSAKEALVRVKSALQNQDFDWGVEKHLVVSCTGADRVRSGLCDLALAVSVLSETKQLKLSAEKDLVFIGELGIDGTISDLSLGENGLVPDETELWLGNFRDPGPYTLKVEKLSDLNDLKKDIDVISEGDLRPAPYTNQVQMLSPEWIELFEIVTHGEHSLLFLTPQNSALVDFCKLIRKNLKRLDHTDLKEVRLDKEGLRPFVALGASVSKWQVLGLSAYKNRGLYYYGNGGVVFMDNFFALNKGVRESVGALLNDGSLSGDKQLNSTLFARSSLCPCGKAQVGVPRKCSFSLYKCRSVIEKISLDEMSLFQVVVAGDSKWQELYPHPELDLSILNQRRQLAYDVQQARGQVVSNARLGLHELSEMMSEACRAVSYLPKVEGLERTRSILSVARSLADLEGSLKIESEHIEKALEYVFRVPKEVMTSF